MNKLFNRQAYVVAGPVETITGVTELAWPYIKLDKPIPKNNVAFTGLKTAFTVKKNLEKKENEADIEIYNVSKDTYSILEGTDEIYKVKLIVGYGEAKHQLFFGDIEEASYVKDGPNWVLIITGKDGQKDIQDSLIDKSYRGGSDLKNILIDTIKSLPSENFANFKDSLKWIKDNIIDGKKTNNGVTLTGKVFDNLQVLLKSFNASMSFQDGKAQIIWDNSNTKDDIVLISPSSGLIESPKRKDEGIEFRCLLIPLLKPGALIKIESRSITDYFRIDNIDFKGDTYGNDWECRCEATKPSNIVTTLPKIQYYKSLSIEDELYSTWGSLI